jgi:outer membrane protein assembly factor BamB
MKYWLILAGVFVALGSSANDWPQWRGPNRTGISTDKVSPWPAEGPKTVWRAAVGTGFSSISVSEGRAYTMGNTNEEDTVWCFDSRSGKPAWKHTYSSKLGPQYYEGGPGATPTIDNHRIYTISKWGDVFCFETASGKILWQRDLRQEGLKPNRWGFSGSPLVWHDLLILNAGSAGTALDLATGRTAWCNGTNAAGYASPALFHSTHEEIVLIFAAKHLVALEPGTGRELWRRSFETGYDTNNSDPVIYRDEILLSSYSRGCALLSAKAREPELVYESKNLFNHLSPGILQGEYLYAFNGEAKTKDTDFRCIHLPTGEVKWTQKDPAFGSVICTDGRLLLLSEKGEIMLAEASPTGFKPLARAQVLGGLCWTPPTLANGLLYARNAQGDLVCLQVN